MSKASTKTGSEISQKTLTMLILREVSKKSQKTVARVHFIPQCVFRVDIYLLLEQLRRKNFLVSYCVIFDEPINSLRVPPGISSWSNTR